jgi:hypothetical protein
VIACCVKQLLRGHTSTRNPLFCVQSKILNNISYKSISSTLRTIISVDMHIKTLALGLISTTAVSAHPAHSVRPGAVQEHISAPYTAGDAYNDCQGKGLGDFVCWANEDAKSYGRMGSSDLSMLVKVAERAVAKNYSQRSITTHL